MGEKLRIQLIIHTACETWMNERLCVQKVAKHLPEGKIVFWHLRNFHKLKFSMKSLAFLCLICAPNLYFAQKLLRRTKNCWVTRTAKKFLQQPKVAQKLPSTIRDRPMCYQVLRTCLHRSLSLGLQQYLIHWIASLRAISTFRGVAINHARTARVLFGLLRSPLERESLLAGYFIAAWSPKTVFALKYV